MEYTVRLHDQGRITEKKAEEGTNLLKFLRRNSIEISSPCGGNGTCGKCKVRVAGLKEDPSKKESRFLDTKTRENGYRLACYNEINGELDIYIGKKDADAKVVTHSKERKVKLDPIIVKEFITLPQPDLKDQSSDLERVLGFTKKSRVSNSIGFLKKLPDILRSEKFEATLVYLNNRLISVESGDTARKLFGVAVDIGTTTLAAYLVDLTNGEKIQVSSALNPQKVFGADVISRINHTIETENGLQEINTVIINCINSIIENFEQNNGISREDIYAVTLVGNTTMIHFLMELPTRYIASSPFIPVTAKKHELLASELGIGINPNGYAVILPSVAAYIGADTVAAVLSSGMYADSKISLLVDIGTNGEIVLGNCEWMYSCSVAAGPAFEGAHIRNGVGGVRGAIDKVRLVDEFEYSTIDNDRAIGLCGSGIVDAVSQMLSRGIIDETGRVVEAEECDSLPESLKSKICEIDGFSSLLLLNAQDCDAGMDIAVTQKDVRELQNAKAAIAAGIKTLAKHAGIRLQDIDRVYLAGGFGSYINIDSALNIGLLPKELKGKIESIGNAAGAGAVESLISLKMLAQSEKIKNIIKYIELSADKDFVDEYIECMMFE